MTDSLIHPEIDRLLASLDGELTTHSRVVDGLLDLRCATDDVHLIAIIDDSLATVPGRTAVDTNWWKNQLTSFRVMVELAGVRPTDELSEAAYALALLVGSSTTFAPEASS